MCVAQKKRVMRSKMVATIYCVTLGSLTQSPSSSSYVIRHGIPSCAPIEIGDYVIWRGIEDPIFRVVKIEHPLPRAIDQRHLSVEVVVDTTAPLDDEVFHIFDCCRDFPIEPPPPMSEYHYYRCSHDNTFFTGSSSSRSLLAKFIETSLQTPGICGFALMTTDLPYALCTPCHEEQFTVSEATNLFDRLGKNEPTIFYTIAALFHSSDGEAMHSK